VLDLLVVVVEEEEEEGGGRGERVRGEYAW
jgi:hypothetical protein